MSSHASIFYGLLPTFALQASAPKSGARIRSLPESLNEAGIRTAVFGHGPVFRVAPVQHSFAERHQGRNVKETLEQFDAFADAFDQSLRHGFVFVHVYDIHAPYFETPERLDVEPLARERALSFQDELRLKGTDSVKEAYESGVAFVDHHLDGFFERLDELERSHDLLVIITSDHGEAFGEHKGFFEHTAFLYEEIVRVPLVLYRSGRPQGDRYAEAVSGIDLAPTFLEFFGVGIPDQVQGRSLLHDGPRDRAVVLEGRKDEERAIVLGDDELITRGERPEIELFDLASDPLEQRDLAAERPELVPDLGTRLENLFRTEARRLGLEKAPTDRHQRELSDQLKALGYVQ